MHVRFSVTISRDHRNIQGNPREASKHESVKSEAHNWRGIVGRQRPQNCFGFSSIQSLNK